MEKTTAFAINSSNIDDILKQLNIISHQHEQSLIRAHIKDNSISFETIQNILTHEVERLGSGEILRLMEGYILAMIYGYSVTPTDKEGDLLQLLPEHVDLGQELLETNKDLWGTRVFPLLLYGSEYLLAAQEMIPEELLDLEDLGISKELPYDAFIDMVVRTALQTRYKHLVRCETEEVFGNEEYRKTDFSGDVIQEGRLLEVDKP